MRPFRWLLVVIAVGGIAGCIQRVPGPLPPDPTATSTVLITPMAPARGEPYEISATAAEAVASSPSLSEYGWIAAGSRRLEPLYRLDLTDGARIVGVYWLGTNSHPPQFPCYALCSGWWIGGSTAEGELDPTRYKGLTSAQYFYLLNDLGVW